MLHLYGTRAEYEDMGESNVGVCEEVQHWPGFRRWGEEGGQKTQVYMHSRGMNA